MTRPMPLHDYAHSRAVLIGAWDYKNLPDVGRATYNSLARMQRVLSGPLCGWPTSDTGGGLAVVGNPPRRGDLPNDLVGWFNGITDIALFYFVGHGQLYRDELYLALADSPLDGPHRRTIGLPFSDVRTAMDECDASTKIVILDCCFSGQGTLAHNALSTPSIVNLTACHGAATLAATDAYGTAWFETLQDDLEPQTFFTKCLLDTIEQGLPGHPEGLPVDAVYSAAAETLAHHGWPKPTRLVRHDASKFIIARNRARKSSTINRGTLVAGRYELMMQLGKGGMGEVWASRDRNLRRDVALKFVAAYLHDSPDLLARFEREAVVAAQIHHQNVATVFDRGVHGDLPFLVMELIDGMMLDSWIHQSGVLALADAFDLGEQICAALQAIHQAEAMHLDIKPHNVLVTPQGIAKVVDFGIADLRQAEVYSLADVSHIAPALTPAYAAPEQFNGQGDKRSDLYAFGGVLFAMLTGKAPFSGNDSFTMLQGKKFYDASRLERLRPGLPSPLTGLIAQLLERDPERRPQSAREVRKRLAHLRAMTVENEPRT